MQVFFSGAAAEGVRVFAREVIRMMKVNRRHRRLRQACVALNSHTTDDLQLAGSGFLGAKRVATNLAVAAPRTSDKGVSAVRAGLVVRVLQ